MAGSSDVEREPALLPGLKVVVALGKIAFDSYLDVLKKLVPCAIWRYN